MCDSILFNLDIQSYSTVCGRVLGYQKGTSDGFWNFLFGGQATIDSAYMDGVSLTHGPAGSRQHIWTFTAGLHKQDRDFNTRFNCLYTNTRYNWTYQLPTFMGNSYFCDTGNPGPGVIFDNIYSSDPLWDGAGCDSSFNTCCRFNSPPWFQTTLPQTTSDDIELRVCHGEATEDEDTVINLIEIYVK